MKNIVVLCMVTGMLATKAFTQPTDSIAKEKMKPFANWVGHWQGESTTEMRQSEPKKALVDEYVTFKLNGAVLQFDGLGKASSAPETVVHNAMGILYFDQAKQKYGFNAFLHDGRNTAAWFDIIEENKYQWGFDVPSGNIRYTITLDSKANTWDEIGEYSPDKGKTWYKFFQMKLKKV